jgi:hypothetical protein
MVCAHTHPHPQPPAERVAILRWAAGLGAVTAEALAERHCIAVASARARLGSAERHGLLARCRPLAGRPALYAATCRGLRVAGAHGLEPCRVSPSNALHLIECAGVAAALERCYPDHRVQGERELRRDERERRRALASAELGGIGPRGETLVHRPDLVLWPEEDSDPPALPVAVEVELTVKAPRRLADICRAWARARCVAGVLYLAPTDVLDAVQRAIDRTHAHERVVVVPLDSLPRSASRRTGRAGERSVPSGA